MPRRTEYAHRYSLRDDQGRRLVDHGAIRLFGSSTFQIARVETGAERWPKVLEDGEHLDPEHLPEWMQHPIMTQAMSILSRFYENERDDHRERSRQEALRVHCTIQRSLDQTCVATETARANEQAARAAAGTEHMARDEARATMEAERRAKETAFQDKESALAEVLRIKAFLQQHTDR
ncbi:hypothetical protein [Thiocapsa bogorovii]|uniref:hypothetical protein n=1 Tax=Thiocapsa bogorovii TaxID=521689 RepID=UPI001E357906|nr:hypothetical protein [Thiocapsa bogorovii]UHD16873.1 hypothetical protein LT988_02060 [Thiocapsa bogorovii]